MVWMFPSISSMSVNAFCNDFDCVCVVCLSTNTFFVCHCLDKLQTGDISYADNLLTSAASLPSNYEYVYDAYMSMIQNISASYAYMVSSFCSQCYCNAGQLLLQKIVVLTVSFFVNAGWSRKPRSQRTVLWQYVVYSVYCTLVHAYKCFWFCFATLV